MDHFGAISFARDATDWNDLDSGTEVFYLAIASAGAYCYRGFELGIFVSRCRLQTDDAADLTEIGKRWTDGFKNQVTIQPLLLA